MRPASKEKLTSPPELCDVSKEYPEKTAAAKLVGSAFLLQLFEAVLESISFWPGQLRFDIGLQALERSGHG